MGPYEAVLVIITAVTVDPGPYLEPNLVLILGVPLGMQHTDPACDDPRCVGRSADGVVARTSRRWSRWAMSWLMVQGRCNTVARLARCVERRGAPYVGRDG
jgi:hypothetical protein